MHLKTAHQIVQIYQKKNIQLLINQTHGGKTDINAHPHCDMKSRIAFVRNGTISNCTELKNELIETI